MSEVAYKTSIVTTTELGRINQLSATVATKFLVLPDTTLNKKYNVLTEASITTFPRIRYFGIGIKGYANISSENNIAQPYQPSPSDMDLYEPIPFRCVPTPLSQTEAAKYRMVTKVTLNGRTYYQYWLKLLEFETDQPKLTTVTGNREVSHILNTSNLYPTPTNLTGTDVSSSIGSRSEVSVTAIRRVTGEEVCEVIGVMYGGDLRRARISEFGLYSGIEKAQCTLDGIPYTYNEAAYVQLASHMCMIGHDLSSVNSSIDERCVIQTGAVIQI